MQKKIRGGERIIDEKKVIIKRISEKMYFDYELKFIEEIEEYIRVSDPEKTLIDILYYNYPFREEIFSSLLEICNALKIKRYLEVIKERKIKGWRKIEEVIGIDNY